MIVQKFWKNRIGLVSESLTKGLLVMVILERIKGEPSGNKVFKDFVYRDCLKSIGFLKHKRWMGCMFLVRTVTYLAGAIFKRNEDYSLPNH